MDFSTLPACKPEAFRTLPEISAVYFLLRGNECLYVGQSVNLRQRITKHSRRLKEYHEGSIVAWQPTEVAELDAVETEMITSLHPPLNKRQKATHERRVIGKGAMVLVAGFVPPCVKRVIIEMADAEIRTPSNMLCLLLEEHPRIKRALREHKSNGGKP